MADRIDSYSGDWKRLMRFLPKGWEEQCYELAALQRWRQFNGPSELLRVLLIHLLDGCSLRETAVRARMAGIADVSDVAILKRLNQAAQWFHWMTEQFMHCAAEESKSLFAPFPGKSFKLLDATHVRQGRSRDEGWRLHYAFDLVTLACNELMVSDYSTGESFKNFTIEKNSVYLADAGYYHPEGLWHIVNGGADVIVRMSCGGPVVYQPDGSRFNLLGQLRSLRGEAARDWPAVHMQTKDGRIVYGRICARRKSKKASEKGIKQLYQKHAEKKKRPRPETIEAARYIFVFTTLPRQMASPHSVLELYRSRWQIELLFKRLKSLLDVGHLPKQSMQGAKAWINGKLFCAALLEALVHRGECFSPLGTTEFRRAA